MRTYLFLLTVLLAPAFSQAQEAVRVQNGAILTVQNGALFTVNGGITLDNGSKLNHDGIITVRDYGGSGTANWTDNSTTAYTYGTGTTIFNGSTGQTISTPNQFGAVTVNTARLTLGTNVNASSWLLINGMIATNSNRLVAVSTSTNAIQADAANPNYSISWINGTVRRYIAASAADSYDFPVGNDGQSNLVTLAGLTADPLTGTQYLDVNFGPKPGTDNGLIVTEDGNPYISVNTAGVWHLTPDTEPAGGKFNLLCYFNGFSGLLDNSFALLERPDASSNAADWTVPTGSTLPASGDAGRTIAGGYAQRNGLTAFSQWGIGQTVTPLPVTLLDFDAHRISRSLVGLSWETAMEENNKGFEIDRQTDSAAGFMAVGWTPTQAPGGNSNNTLNYSYTDTNSYSGISYYRLKQEDLNNNYIYSAIKAVAGESGVTVSLFPNPGHGQFVIRVEGTTNRYSVLVTDITGRLMRQLEAVGGSDLPVTGLNQGAYVVYIPDIFGNGQSFTEKVLIVP